MTVRFHTTTEGGEDDLYKTVLTRRCVYCQRPIRWLATYENGARRAFDAQPVARADDFGAGWIPGHFVVHRRSGLLFAPMRMHAPEKQARAQTVMILHTCPGRPDFRAA